jgi:serine/threonine-protein kinase
VTKIETGTQLGVYVLGEKLDEGGMGAIYRAFKPGSNTLLAIKTMLPIYSTDTSLRKRFDREVAMLRDLKHPHIIPVLDFGEQDGTLYFVMPFINGQSVARMSFKQKFSPATTWLILEPIARALTFAHQHAVIHRDLKPGNILVEMSTHVLPGGFHPYLADFGLSKPIDKTTMTEAGIVIGTPQYMAPEQVKAHAVSAQTDIYALGIVLYEMLLGRTPFPSGKPEEIALKQVQAEPPVPTTLNPDFPKPLEDVLLKALQKKEKDRFESAEAMGAAYWSALQKLPLPAKMRDYWVARRGS